MQHSGTGLRFIDYDNDGWKDLLVSQGHVVDAVDIVNPNLHYREPISSPETPKHRQSVHERLTNVQ